METKELIEVLQHCGKPGSDCHNCKMYQYSASCLRKLCNEAATALEYQQKRIAELEEQQRWIPVTERLPENKGEYLVVFHPCWWDDVKLDNVWVGTDTFRGKTTWAKKKFQRVTHWMPLPEPPKEV